MNAGGGRGLDLLTPPEVAGVLALASHSPRNGFPQAHYFTHNPAETTGPPPSLRGSHTPGGREGKVQAPISLKMLLKSRKRSSKPKLSWKCIPPPGLKLKPKANSSADWGPSSNLALPGPHEAPSSSSSSSSSSRVIPPKKGSLRLGVEADWPPKIQHYLN